MSATFVFPQAHLAIATAIFIASYLVFAIGKFPGTKVDRPAMAVIGAVLMFAFRVLRPEEALRSIDFATLILLFSMMLIVAALHIAGFFEWITGLVIRHLAPGHLLPGIIGVSGILSAFLVNDVVCLFLTPLILRICGRTSRQPLPYLLALATASNIGSTATVTGNPQNILIGSVSGIAYSDFLLHLGPVAVVGLVLDWAVLQWMFRAQFAEENGDKPVGKVEFNEVRARTVWPPLTVTVLVLLGFLAGLPPALVAASGGAALLFRRTLPPHKIYEEVDWSLLVFFLGLFLVLGGAEQAGIAARILSFEGRWNIQNTYIFTVITVALSNIVSNVPAVMLLKNPVAHFANPHRAWLLLAMASTLAGNLTITGSVANMIVVEKARGEAHIGFLDYLRVGIPVTFLTIAFGVFWLERY